MRAWTFQDPKQLAKLGGKCPWSVGWYHDGKRKQKTIGCKSLAEKRARKMEGQLEAGTYESKSRKNWSDFMAEYESKALANMEPGTREAMQYALNHFERIVNPVKMQAVTSRAMADYTTARRLEPRRRTKIPVKGAPLVSPATVNKELRSLRAVLRKAARWGYIARAPEFEFLKEPGKLPTYVPPDDFAKLYAAGESARWPDDQPFPAADWWRALLVAAYMTGWRIGSLLALRWEDVDQAAGTALSRAADNKGRRDQLIPLHPLVVEHLARLKSFSALVFPWNHGRRALFAELHALEAAAKVKPAGKAHYGFHDLRRAFATMNADKLTPDALQALMQHKDYQTTQRYISMARQLNPAVAGLYVPQITAPARVAT